MHIPFYIQSPNEDLPFQLPTMPCSDPSGCALPEASVHFRDMGKSCSGNAVSCIASGGAGEIRGISKDNHGNIHRKRIRKQWA